jgi:putative nucleotidyltransferase with HDIG domain
MKLETAFLRSKVGRRMFTLFFLCALVPIIGLAIISFGQVAAQLRKQSQMRLGQATKTQEMSVLERLELLDAGMRTIALGLSAGSSATAPRQFEQLARALEEGFKGLELITNASEPRAFFGRVQSLPELTAAQKQRISSGQPLVSTEFGPHLPPRVLIFRTIDPDHPTRGTLVGEIDAEYLSAINTLAPETKLYLLDNSGQVLIHSPGMPDSLAEQGMRKIIHSASGEFEWNDGDKKYLASYRSLFLKPRFFTPAWTVVLSEARAEVLAPMANFKRTFPLVILVSLWVVLLLSLLQIRRSLVPLEKLQEGTRRVAKKDFSSPVKVTSGDEFQELATSFNAMATHLDKQFNALTTIHEIDRAILSALTSERVADTVLVWMPRLLPCDAVTLSLIDSDMGHTGRTYLAPIQREGDRQVHTTTLAPEEVLELRDHPDTLVIKAGNHLPNYLAPLAGRGLKSFLVMPIFLREQLSGIISLGYSLPPAHGQEDLLQARQVADQVALALSNARLIEELDQFNWGTLTALARAIDAKSPWTAGHSERVTKLGIKIGRALGLPPKELDALHRGGLLHDIGKIGTPPTILDKPGKLDPEEMCLMRDHVRMGARILEPIPGFTEVLPIVWQHHEWFDGSGYPNALAGESIHLHGRIFAVADVYDALGADRPYRASLPRDRVIDYVREMAGTQFDPRVVQAFLEVMAEEDENLEGQPTHAPLAGAF